MEKLTYTVEVEKAKLLKFLCDNSQKLSYDTLSKLLRKKDIKVNGKRTNENLMLTFGDKVEVFASEDMFSKKVSDVDVVFEDDNIVIVNKARGKEVVTDSGFDLLSDVQAHVGIEKKVRVRAVHRLDKITTGLVVFAKTDEAEKELNSAFKNRTIKKLYTCTVVGKFPFKSCTKRAYLKKDSEKSKVFVSDIKKPGYEQIITHFEVVKAGVNTKLMVELVTGKTHQIRAHLAHLGYPLVGDSKYGTAKTDSAFDLCAVKIVFSFKPEQKLYYLNGKQIELKTGGKNK